MTTWRDFLSGKKVTQLGLGLLGRGVRDADFLAKYCDQLTVTDKKSAEDLATSVQKLSAHSNIVFKLGAHDLADFEGRDFILKGAGVPITSPEIARAREAGIPVYMDESLFVTLAPEVKLVGTTGTRGKTTTTLMLHAIVERAFVGDKQVFLGGNVKDVATLPLLETAQPGDIIVAELSSWQLQGFRDIATSPSVSVFTNLLPDHLNYYPSMKEYFNDKAQIFAYQKAGDTLIVTEQSQNIIKEMYEGEILSNVIVARPEDVTDVIAGLKVPGEHNRVNAACAVYAARALGVDDETIKEAISAFGGAPGRLEPIGDFKGVSVFDDTTSTTPDALRVALSSMADRAGKVVLIMGGADKGLDFTEMIPTIPEVAKVVIMTPGNGTVRISSDVETACAARGIKVIIAASTADAVAFAREHSVAGDSILFSPGFASFAEFKNEFDRGDHFREFIAAEFATK
jgi:UDP-N-acetylmuramoylalanine--D-glutamate ligase